MKNLVEIPMVFVVFIMMLFAFFAIIGCSETESDVLHDSVPEGAAFDTLSSVKQFEVVAAAPSAPGVGQPFVKEVGFYRDWKLTKAIDRAKAGDTVWMKVVFSEPMQFHASDEKNARPILYYKVTGEEMVRFRIAPHGAGGEDFVSGDAKPKGGGTDDYIGKYVVPENASGNFTISVGKFNTDKDGNTLPAFYTHKEKLELGDPKTPDVSVVVDPVGKEDTLSPTVVSITHRDESGMELSEDASVVEGTTILTEIVFSEPMETVVQDGVARPVITYTTGGVTKRFVVSLGSGVHWRGLCKPSENNTVFTCKASAAGDSYSVSVGVESIDLAGNHLAASVTSPVLEVTPRPVVSKPIVVTPEQPVPTTRQDLEAVGGFTGGTTKGIHSFPEEVQPLTSVLQIPADIHLVLHEEHLNGLRGGRYQHNPHHSTVTVFGTEHNLRRNVFRIIAAELFHAHQYTITGGNINAWVHTPEGKAYVEAERKDLSDVGPFLYYDKIRAPSYETSSSLFSYYFGLHYLDPVYAHIKDGAPNRYAWAVEWFGE